MSNTQTLPPAPQILELTPILDVRKQTDIPVRLNPLQHVVAWTRRHILFTGLVIIPTLIAVVYYGLIASDQYASEARFIVRSASTSGQFPGLAGLGGQASAIQAVAPGQSLSRAPDDTNSVNEYIRSRDAVEKLERDNDLRPIFAREEGDLFNRFPNFYSRDTRENLYRHYLNFIDIAVQSDTGISVLEVRSFTPEDSQKLAFALLQHAEKLINKLNVRAREDAVHFAEDVVRKAEERIALIQSRIADFRNREMIVDPGKQSEAALELITRLTGETAFEKARLEQILAMTPSSPQIEPLRSRIRSMEEQITQQRALIVGGDKSIAQKLSQFEQISLERELAIKSLTSALISLENSRQEAQRQQLYLERVVEPHLPDQPLYPKRMLWIGFVFGVSLCIFWIVRETLFAVLEHHL